MFTAYNGLTVAATIVLGAVSFLLLLDRRDVGGRPSGRLARSVERWLGRGAVDGWGWRAVAGAIAVGYALVAAFDLATGLYACQGVGGSADVVGLLRSGQAFWSGNDPFTVPDCGVPITVPYGLAAVMIDALGSLGGPAGIAAVWGIVAVAIVPLVWKLGGTDRRYLTLVVATLPIYFPLVATQIDGATNAIVPVAVLGSIALAGVAPAAAPLLAGLLASARFPSLFPVLASHGREARPFGRVLLTLGAFAAATAVAYAVWGSAFFGVVFSSQLGRRSFSLNAFGPLIDHGWLPTATWVVALQAALTMALTAAGFVRGRTPLHAAAIVLTGIALLTPFLSFNVLVGLLPVALVGTRPRWWLWGVSMVGALNYDLALSVLAWNGGVYAPSEALDVLLAALLAGLFVDLWRGRPDDLSAPASGSPAAVTGGPTPS